MRILHTSDWHLGISHGAVSRAPDHDRFLDWLIGELEARGVDTLVIAGDVFDSMQPSAEALGRYYRFLRDVARSGVAQVIVVGGNHDSAARLDAPAAVLGALDVHVVGGITARPESRARCIVPLRDRTGAVRAVCLAVPYVHEFRLGVRTTDLDDKTVRAAFRERFAALYRELVDAAQADFPGLPIVATGHLTVGTEATPDDYPQEIHQVGTLEALPADVFDARIQYAALGHIHRSYPVGASRRIWYSGSPVAFSLAEGKTPRKVLQVDLDANPAGAAAVEAVAVPAARALVELRDAPDALLARIRALTWGEALPPLLFCRAVTDDLPPDLPSRLHEALGAHPEAARPALAELRQERATPLPADEGDDARPPDLGDLQPTEVFRALCRSRGLADTAALESAFSSLQSATQDDFDAMLQRVRGGVA